MFIPVIFGTGSLLLPPMFYCFRCRRFVQCLKFHRDDLFSNSLFFKIASGYKPFTFPFEPSPYPHTTFSFNSHSINTISRLSYPIYKLRKRFRISLRSCVRPSDLASVSLSVRNRRVEFLRNSISYVKLNYLKTDLETSMRANRLILSNLL